MTTGRHPLTLLTALLAILCQLALGQAVPASAPAPGVPAIHICGAQAPQPSGSKPPHPAMDCVQCPLCAGLASALVVPPGPKLPPPAAIASAPELRADIAGDPPPSYFAAAHPRGPPTLT